MLSGFLTNAMNFQNAEGSFNQNIAYFFLLYCNTYWSCRSIFRLCSDNAVIMVLCNSWYNTFVS